MHWSDEIAQRVIEKNPDKEVYTCAAGYSPSGSGHIGNFRDIATSYFVCRALRRLGKRARLLFSWCRRDQILLSGYDELPEMDISHPILYSRISPLYSL